MAATIFRLLTLLFFALVSYGASAQEILNMKAEYLEEPIGIDTDKPRFSWKYRVAPANSWVRVILSTDSASLKQGKSLYWAGKWSDSAAIAMVYDGKKLQSFTKYYWLVETRNKQGNVKRSQIASMETGMMKMSDWKGSWISDSEDRDLKPAPFFRREFRSKGRIKKATVYIAAAGLFELTINGKRVGDHQLDPMYTRFDRRNLYVTHDVTGFLIDGANAIGVLLGNGWYNHQSTAVWNFHIAPWRSRPAFCLDLRITYDDGSVDVITSGKDWKTSLSQVVFNSIYTAEHVDFRSTNEKWNLPGFDDTKWRDVIYRTSPSGLIKAQALHPIRRNLQLKPVSIRKLSDSVHVFDFGQNIAGVVELNLQGPAGTVVRMKHGERLYPDGRVDQSNIDVHYRPKDNTDPFQTDVVILSGNGKDRFVPRFNYKGFQFVEVHCSNPIQLNEENLQAYFMHSDVPATGAIESSSDLINKIWKATNNSYLSNLYGYPTDCPQREKNGWTGDAHIAIETGLYNFDGITVYEKWLDDHRDEQQPNGVLPSIIPTGGWGYEWGNGPDWTSTIAIIPWNLYLFYGDLKPLAECYENIRRYVDHIDELYPTGLTSWGLGDWVPVKSKSPVELTSTAYYFTDAVILANAAALLGKPDDEKKYRALSARIRKAFNDKYLDAATGIYGSGFQTELSVALHWGLVPDTLRNKVALNLARRVEADSFHLDVGLLGTKTILNALSDNGYAETAYRIASQDTYPSWGWWIRNGATTLFENWPIDAKSDISMNHIMFGEIGAWLYKSPGGIKPDPSKPGFRNVLIQPHFVSGLEHFTAKYESVYGEIISSWRRSDDALQFDLTIPPAATATVTLPVMDGMVLYENNKQLKTTTRTYNFNRNAGTHKYEYRKIGQN